VAFKIRCPECGTALRATADMVGRDIRCGACESVFPVPEAPPRPRRDDRDDRDDRDERAESGRDEDEDYERRPRRRRPARPPGRSAAFWVLLVGGGLAFVALACCGGGYLMLPGEKWHTHRSPGGYSVDVPIDPNPNLQIPGVAPDPNLHTEGGVLWRRGECYVVLYGEVLPRTLRAESDEDLIREAVRGMSQSPDVRRVVRDEAVAVSGFPGHEIEFEGTDGGTYVGRVVIADRRVFMVIGGGRFVRPKNANIRRFVDSFRVTDPTLKAADPLGPPDGR
jgi:hypothetical protein